MYICSNKNVRMIKICKNCNRSLNESEFYISGNYKNKISRLNTCKKCTNQLRKNYNKNYRKQNKDVVNANKRRYFKERMNDVEIRNSINLGQRERYSKYAIKRLWVNAKKRAETKNLKFNLELKDIIIPEFCPILNIPIFTGSKNNYDNSPSLDRINNEFGYIKENVKVISTLANTMKNKATVEQLLMFSKNIITYLNNKDIVRTIENNNL
jgi:hypothetical protein